MPEVSENESEKDYMKRCVPYLIDKEGLEQKHAVAKCYGMFRQHRKGMHKRYKKQQDKGAGE